MGCLSVPLWWAPQEQRKQSMQAWKYGLVSGYP